MPKTDPYADVTVAPTVKPETKKRRPSTVNGKPKTVDRKPKTEPTWEQMHKRTTYHAHKPTLKALEGHAKETGESMSSLHNRAVRELLERAGVDLTG